MRKLKAREVIGLVTEMQDAIVSVEPNNLPFTVQDTLVLAKIGTAKPFIHRGDTKKTDYPLWLGDQEKIYNTLKTKGVPLITTLNAFEPASEEFPITTSTTVTTNQGELSEDFGYSREEMGVDFTYDNHGTILSYHTEDQVHPVVREAWNTPTIPWWIKVSDDNIKEITEFPFVKFLKNKFDLFKGCPEIGRLFEAYTKEERGVKVCILTGAMGYANLIDNLRELLETFNTVIIPEESFCIHTIMEDQFNVKEGMATKMAELHALMRDTPGLKVLTAKEFATLLADIKAETEKEREQRLDAAEKEAKRKDELKIKAMEAHWEDKKKELAAQQHATQGTQTVIG